MRSDAWVRVEAELAEAETYGRCFAAVERNDRIRYARLLDTEKNLSSDRRRLVSPYPNLYLSSDSWAGKDPDERARLVAHGVARLHPDWVFCGSTAALMHGLAVPWQRLGIIEAVTPSSVGSQERPLVRRRRIDDCDVEDVEGAQVTGVTRTVFDCLGEYDFRDGLALADSELRMSGCEACDLISSIDRRFSKRRGIRKALALAAHADGRAESGGESIARAVMIEEGVYLPNLQVELPDLIDPSNRYRVDFAWDGKCGLVVGELDGQRKYVDERVLAGATTIDALCAERLRESHLTAGGVPVARFGFSDLRRGSEFKFVSMLEKFGVPVGRAPRIVNGVPDKSEVLYGGWNALIGSRGFVAA